jgi:hypothetical protein|tara:strand:- start:45 stop:251 length:207 start_codon:yes stop_codon:yes gene_type:complete
MAKSSTYLFTLTGGRKIEITSSSGFFYAGAEAIQKWREENPEDKAALLVVDCEPVGNVEDIHEERGAK